MTPTDLEVQLEQAVAFHQQGRFPDAEVLYRSILARAPLHFAALHLLGVVHYQTGRHADAIEWIERAISVNPNVAFAHYNRALALQAINRPADALASYDRVLRLTPDYADAYVNRGNALRDLKRPDEALASYDRALSLKPDFAQAFNNRGSVLFDAKRTDEALASYDRALQLMPDFIEAHENRAVALESLQRYEEALVSYDKAIALQPDHAGTRVNRGNLLARELHCYEQAIPDFEYVLRLDPEHDYARGQLLHMRMQCCDWRDFERDTQAIEAGVREGKRVCWPFAFQAISRSPADLKTCSEIFTDDIYPAAKTPLWIGERHRHGKIRLGYVSGEFREQATSYLTAGLFELHDKSRFELFAFDNGFDDGGPMRKRLAAAFADFVDISRSPDLAAAQLIREREIDILIDLNGYFGRERTGIFALRPAPLQVNYLGFPATLGADYMDYIVADRIVIPEGEQNHYSEKIVYLPDTYQVNDAHRGIAGRTPTRAEAGLPETGFVFCSFNNSYKYTPAMFDIWMRLLLAVQGSVLWLFESNDAVAKNLRREGQARGVAPERLIFARHVQLDEHLARQRLGDLFLDALPYNAHTTASDALWAGLPVLTCVGSTFPGRVAASLLAAVGLPELVTRNLADYETLALKLARDAGALAVLKAKLAANRLTMPLFDTNRFRRHLEAAFVVMWDRHRHGEPAETFAVP